MTMEVEEIFSMVGGDGETNYASNSKFQGKVITSTKPVLAKAVEETYRRLLPEKAVVADLGCSHGPNTFLVVSYVLDAIGELCRRLEQKPVPEIQFFLNDLPMNDFNGIFRSLRTFEKKMEEEKGDLLVPHYVAAVGGSFYGRLFPCESVHFFNSSYSLMWLSRVPQGLKNDGNICVAKTSPPQVLEAYQEQFRKDFSKFLKLRYEELITGGGMVLAFMGRKEVHPADYSANYCWTMVAEALNSMVSEGIITKEKVDSFNLPLYAASMEEVKTVIAENEGLFDLEQAQLLEVYNYNFDDDAGDDLASKRLKEVKLIEKATRAGIEPLVAHHFGDAVLDDLFSRFASNCLSHPREKNIEAVSIVLALRKRERCER